MKPDTEKLVQEVYDPAFHLHRRICEVLTLARHASPERIMVGPDVWDGLLRDVPLLVPEKSNEHKPPSEGFRTLRVLGVPILRTETPGEVRAEGHVERPARYVNPLEAWGNAHPEAVAHFEALGRTHMGTGPVAIPRDLADATAAMAARIGRGKDASFGKGA